MLIQQPQTTPQYNTIQRCIQRKRKVNGNPIANPITIQQILIPIELKQIFYYTIRERTILIVFLIFGTERNLDILADNITWFADGTFKVAPHLFYQLHTIHALHEHSVVPLMYVFMQRKQQIDYATVVPLMYVCMYVCIQPCLPRSEH